MKELQQALDKAVKDSGAPGAVAIVGRGNETIFHGASGWRSLVPDRAPAEKDTLYDLASLSKVISTTTCILLLQERGALDLDQPVSDFVPLPSFKRMTIQQLLTHTAGLPPFKLWYKEASSLDEYIERIALLELESEPGTRRVYSDLGFMMLGKVVEIAGRDSLDAFARENIFKPLGMKLTGYNPAEALHARCAATEDCPWRGKVMQGQVHDENAYAVGGVSGHAGLFAPAGDLAIFCRAMTGGKLLKPETLAMMTRPVIVPRYPWQVLGWKIDPWAEGSEGYLPARRAIGHTGWTGTSVWMDLDSATFVVLLSNTPHPSREIRDNRTLRTTFHTPVAAACYPATTNAHSGLDRVAWEGFDFVRGKRLGVLANQGSVDFAGRPITQVLALEPSTTLVRLFSPEHGFTGHAEAGEQVGVQRAALPIVSLYGEQKRPTPDQLKGIDLFVIDLPDIGARYYTYMATMKACMEACAQAKLPVLVLDRPNPLGGLVLEGPIATDTGSLVCCAAIPIRHGMTLGELALFFKSTQGASTQLELFISGVGGWPRGLMAPQCALPWVSPSPNIPTFESALLYIGTCLFEGVNVNEGRGTETPFQVFGAPWLDPAALIASLKPQEYPGFRLEATTYTPRSIPGKSSTPVYQDTECRGIRIDIVDRKAARPFTLVYALLRAMHRKHARDLTWKPFFDTLAGGKGLREAIQSGISTEAYMKQIDGALKKFDATRPRRDNA